MKGRRLWLSSRSLIAQPSLSLPRLCRASSSGFASGSSYAHHPESIDSAELQSHDLTESLKSDAFCKWHPDVFDSLTLIAKNLSDSSSNSLHASLTFAKMYSDSICPSKSADVSDELS